jgi:hypothetical protein
MSLVNLIALIALTSNFKFLIALPLYLLWCWVVEPLFAKLVGATQAELAEQAAARNKQS